MRTDFFQSLPNRVSAQPDFPVRLSLFLSLGVLLIVAGCKPSSPGDDYREIKPSETRPKPADQTPPVKPLEDPKPPETPQPKPAEQHPADPQPTDPKPKPAETQEVPDDGTTTASLRKKSPALPNPLAGGDDGPVRLLVKEKTFKKKGDVTLVSYDDLDLIKVLNLKVPEPNVMELMPDWLKNLNGQKVQIRGFMYPAFQQEGLERFVFCRDTGACCFGPNPVIYYLINVQLKPGTTTHYIENRPFDVTGTLRIKPAIIPETGLVYELYHLDDAVVRER